MLNQHLRRRPRRSALAAAAIFAAAALVTGAVAAPAPAPLSIPTVLPSESRRITTSDLARIRDIASLGLSSDGRRFTILVRQADPEANTFRTAWFVGEVDGGNRLRFVGDGGDVRFIERANGVLSGEYAGSAGRWSPDGRFIAYTVKRGEEIQIWTSRADGRGSRQVTHNASDVRDFAWSDDGRSLLFRVGTPRAELARRARARSEQGIPLFDFFGIFEASNPGIPSVPLETNLTTWIVRSDGSRERVASEAERAIFESAVQRQFAWRPGGVELKARDPSRNAIPVTHPSGRVVWREPTDRTQTGRFPFLRLTAALAEGAAPIACAADECVGQIFWNVWWSEDGREVVFLRPAGASGREPALYAWSPETGAVRTILHAPDDAYGDCELAAERLICLREAPLLPRHVASVDLHTGAVSVVGDVNPEFSQFRFGAIERIEWDAPPDEAHLGYARRVRGHIIYPPDFDPTRRYPVFIAPYSAAGFKRGDAGDEHPLLVYAANDIIVVNTEFPVSLRAATTGDAASNMRRYYDPERNFPHLTSRMLSTLGGLDAARDRAPIDASRVGIGGVSHGAFIPMFILQNQDRLTAVSLGGPGWTQSEYYLARLPWPADVDRAASMWPEDGKFWSRIDLADHVDAIEAPVLFHYADSEIVAGARLFRRMSDAHLPFDAYSFPGEEHFKWQPAHRLAIYNRNLDWFRFWLQDIEDPDPVKAEQYERWRQLRQLQCRNPRSLRNYCSEADIQTTPAR